MRKEYGSALRELFTEQLSHVCPDFALVKKYAALVRSPGEQAYCCQVSDRLFLWIVLITDQNREAFFIELGWSRHGRFPQLTMRPSFTLPRHAELEDEYLCRLGSLSGGKDFGWVVEELSLEATQEQMMAYILNQTKPLSKEVARSRVIPHIEDALRDLVDYGLPFLNKHSQPGSGGFIQASRLEC